ncbi:MAG: Molybdenum cofactor biosynthesis protein MoaB, partial [uncultured Gemmatimonadetes bacterium]
ARGRGHRQRLAHPRHRHQRRLAPRADRGRRPHPRGLPADPRRAARGGARPGCVAGAGGDLQRRHGHRAARHHLRRAQPPHRAPHPRLRRALSHVELGAGGCRRHALPRHRRRRGRPRGLLPPRLPRRRPPGLGAPHRPRAAPHRVARRRTGLTQRHRGTEM